MKYPNETYVKGMTEKATLNKDNGDQRGGAASSLCLPSAPPDPKNNPLTKAQLTKAQLLSRE